jgi:hypothetical protein
MWMLHENFQPLSYTKLVDIILYSDNLQERACAAHDFFALGYCSEEILLFFLKLFFDTNETQNHQFVDYRLVRDALLEINAPEHLKILVKQIKIYNKNTIISSNSLFYSLLWHCAQHMTYPEFYQAWHGQTENSIPEELRSQNLNYILEKIQTNNPNVRTIDIKILNQETNLDRLAKAIGNRIFAKLISPINDIYDLEYYLKNETPNPALIFYGDNPRESFIQLCQLISDFASIAIITDEPIGQPIQGFLPNQINLENALQTWLEKMVK